MKKLLAILIVLLIACSLLAGCQTLDNHNHTPQTEWASDGTNHYHKCTFDGCMEKLDCTPCTGGNATCTEQAICEKCANPYGTPLGHSHSTEWSKDEANHWHQCTCGDKTNLSSHNWTAGDITTNAGCTTTGKQTYTCVCGATKQEDISATGHSYTSIVTAPTCEGAGYTTYTCSTCGDSYTDDEVDALGHGYTSIVTNPTCTTAGYTTHTCTNCGDSYTDSQLDALGHDWVKGQTTDATCTTDGYTSYSCSTCGSSKQGDEVDALGHSYNKGTCANCGQADPDYIDPETHNHTHTSTSTNPTCTKVGVTTYTCICGDTYTQETPALGHIDQDLDVECDRTGCTSKVAPKADSTLSLTTANHLGAKLSTNNKYYVIGTIVRYYSATDTLNGIFWIADEDGVEFLVRIPKDSDGKLHSTWEYRLLVGDKIKLYGNIGKFNTSVAPKGYYPTMEGGLLVELVQKHTCDFTYRDATCTTPSYCLCQRSLGEPLGHIDENSDKVCDSCNFRTDATIEIITTHLSDIKNTEYVNTTKGTATFVGTQFNVEVNKGSSSLNQNGTNHMRVQNFNNLVITSNNGKSIVSITLVATTDAYIDELQAFITSAGYTYTTNGLAVTINIDEQQSVTLNNTSQKAARIVEVHVAYVDAPQEA